MTENLASRAGSAFFWKAFQHAGVKVIFLIRLFVLARLLSPDDFGLLAISMVIIDILISSTDLGMIPALIQRPDAQEKHYHSAWSIGMARALTISLAVFVAAPLVAQAFKEPRAEALIQVLALRPIMSAAASIKVAELHRALQFRSLTGIMLPEALANTIVAIMLAPTLGVWALVAGALAGPFCFLLASYIVAPHRPRLMFDRQAIASLIRFGRWVFVTGLIVVLGSTVLRLVISRELGTAELGLYFLGARLAFLPSDVAGKVIGDVTFPLYARLQDNLPRAARAYQSVLSGAFALLLPVSILLIFLAPALVEHVLGARWEGTVPVIRILATVSIIGLLGDTIVPILNGVGQPSKVTALEAVQTLLLIMMILWLAPAWGISGAAFAWLPAIIVSQAISIYFMKRILPAPFSGLLIPLLIIFAVSAASGFVALGIISYLNTLAGLVLAITASALLNIGALWYLDKRLEIGLAEGLAQAFPQLAETLGYATGTQR